MTRNQKHRRKNHQASKTKLYLMVIFLFVLGGCAHSDEWTKRDTRMQVAVTVAVLADAYTTSNIRDTPWANETGRARRFIGTQPKDVDIILYFSSYAVATWLITRALPAKWRPWYQSWVGIDTANDAIQNCKEGLC